MSPNALLVDAELCELGSHSRVCGRHHPLLARVDAGVGGREVGRRQLEAGEHLELVRRVAAAPRAPSRCGPLGRADDESGQAVADHEIDGRDGRRR